MKNFTVIYMAPALGMEEMCWSLAHVEPATALVFREFGKEFRERIDVVFVAGNEVSVSEDDIEFARESRPVIGIEEGYVDPTEGRVPRRCRNRRQARTAISIY